MMGLFDVRCSETNISSPMALSASLMISIVKGSSAVSARIAIVSRPFLTADLDTEIANRVQSRSLPGVDHRRTRRFLDHRRTGDRFARGELRSLVDRGLEPSRLIEVDQSSPLRSTVAAGHLSAQRRFSRLHPGHDVEVDQLDRRLEAVGVGPLMET